MPLTGTDVPCSSEQTTWTPPENKRGKSCSRISLHFSEQPHCCIPPRAALSGTSFWTFFCTYCTRRTLPVANAAPGNAVSYVPASKTSCYSHGRSNPFHWQVFVRGVLHLKTPTTDLDELHNLWKHFRFILNKYVTKFLKYLNTF